MPQLKKVLRLALRKGLAKHFKSDRDQHIADSYLAGVSSKNLHLGCGGNPIPGWLNSDYLPKNRDILHLDVTTRFPFENGSFDNVFSEHLIEHMPVADGRKMISECFRVLKDGGVLRTATPDLAFLCALYQSDKSALQQRFLQHFIDVDLKDGNDPPLACWDTFVINKYVRAWGHSFIYDYKTLNYLLESEGFIEVATMSVGESPYAELRGLENTNRKPEGLIALETMVLEATKPCR